MRILIMVVIAAVVTWVIFWQLGARWQFCNAYFPEAPIGCMSYGNSNPPVAPYRGAK